MEKLDFSKLRNEEVYQFGGEVEMLANEEGLPEVEGLAEPFATYSACFNRLGDGLEQVRKSELTEPLVAADAMRDNIYRGFVLHVDAYRHHRSPEKAEAARTIQIVIDTYGDFRNKPYTEVTATIINFIDTLEARCETQVELIGALEWIKDLSETNALFHKMMQSRFDEQSAERIDIRGARRDLVAEYVNFVSLVAALVKLDKTNPAYKNFLDRLNRRIAYYKNLLAQRKGRSKKQDSEEVITVEEDVEIK